MGEGMEDLSDPDGNLRENSGCKFQVEVGCEN